MNCGEKNAEHAPACKKCKMQNNWSHQQTEQPETSVVVENRVLCLNCGHQTSRLQDKCGKCRFPIGKNLETVSTQTLRIVRKTA